MVQKRPPLKFPCAPESCSHWVQNMPLRPPIHQNRALLDKRFLELISYSKTILVTTATIMKLHHLIQTNLIYNLYYALCFYYIVCMRSSQSGASQHTAQANACQFQDCATRQGARQATHLIAKNGGWASWESGDDPFLLGFSLFQEAIYVPFLIPF